MILFFSLPICVFRAVTCGYVAVTWRLHGGYMAVRKLKEQERHERHKRRRDEKEKAAQLRKGNAKV